MRRTVFYVCHPVSPTALELATDHVTAADAVTRNVQRALRWLRWLRTSFLETTFVAPWIAGILSGEDDSDPDARGLGLADCVATVERLDGVVLVGGRVSTGMQLEADHALSVHDLTWLGAEPPRVVEGMPFLAWWLSTIKGAPTRDDGLTDRFDVGDLDEMVELELDAFDSGSTAEIQLSDRGGES